MTSYNPRTDTGIPTEPVGSLPRPMKLQAAYKDYDAGKIGFDALSAEQDKAAADSITRFEATGSPIISDGANDACNGKRALRRDSALSAAWLRPPGLSNEGLACR